MTFTVVYDDNVLYPNTLRDLLIRIAQSGTVQAKWTNAILDEMTAALRRNRPDISAEKIQRLRELMNKAVRDSLVSGYEPLIEGLKLPDPDDPAIRHAAPDCHSGADFRQGPDVCQPRGARDRGQAGFRLSSSGTRIASSSPVAIRCAMASATSSGGWGSSPGRPPGPFPARSVSWNSVAVTNG